MNKNFFEMARDFQRSAMEETAKQMQRAAKTDDMLDTMKSVDVGHTPSEVVYSENKLDLLHYKPMTDEQHDVPLLLVYALINRPYILDLQPNRSVVRTFLENGFDVYLIRWGEPSRMDKHLTLHDYVNRYIENCVDEVRERSGESEISLLGYCMGGTMSAMYSALRPHKVKNLGLMAAGLCFTGEGGLLELWGDEEYYDPRAVTRAYGNVPAEFLGLGFDLMNPVENLFSKYLDLYENVENEDFLKMFARMDQWIHDGVDLSGQTYVQFIEDIYQNNKLIQNEMFLDGQHVDIGNLTMPIAQIVGEYDHLVPPGASKPFNEAVPSQDKTIFEFSSGHIGLSVSSRSHQDLWPKVCAWFEERSRSDSAPSIRSEAPAKSTPEPSSNGGPAESEPSDREAGVVEEDQQLESIKGIGPTFAERLRAAGIDSVTLLANSDLSEVARAADVPESRARDWLEEARQRTSS